MLFSVGVRQRDRDNETKGKEMTKRFIHSGLVDILLRGVSDASHERLEASRTAKEEADYFDALEGYAAEREEIAANRIDRGEADPFAGMFLPAHLEGGSQ